MIITKMIHFLMVVGQRVSTDLFELICSQSEALQKLWQDENVYICRNALTANNKLKKNLI